MRAAIGIVAALATLPAVPGRAETGEDEAIRKALSEDARTTATRAQQTGPAGGGVSFNPDISVVLDAAGAYWSRKDARPGGGHDPSRTGFNLQALELNAAANVDPYFRLTGTVVFTREGVEVEEAYGQTLSLPAGFQVRAGMLLTRFGRHNPTHAHAWAFADQPLVNSKLLGEDGSRGIGLELSWLAPLPWFIELVAGAMEAGGQKGFVSDPDVDVADPRDLLYAVALRQFFPLGREWSLLWGLSGLFGPNDTGPGNRTEIYGTDLFLKWRRPGSPDLASVSVQAEALLRSRQVPGDRLNDFGAYGQVVWHFLRRWETGTRYDFVSGLAADPLDPAWTSDRHRGTVQVTFYPSHFSRLRLQGAMDWSRWAGRGFGVVLALDLAAGAHTAHDY